jgi:L,D-peptidoglycan transpeptidase YkuD (ErfK/YbiS/YcfS/YnhG family)
MIIKLKNKHTLEVDEFQFRCSIGKNGIKRKKIEGDLSTPKGIFKFKEVFYRPDRVSLKKSNIKSKKITKNMGWCDDVKSKYYNKLVNTKIKCRHEKLYRKDNNYDYFIVLDYNLKKTIKGKGSAIFLHLTQNYKPTEGCIAIQKKDFQIMLKLIKKNTYIKI